MLIYEPYAFYLPNQKKILFKFSIYGCWWIDLDLHFESSSCEEAIAEAKDELAIDVVEHRVYAPRIHYFLFDIPAPFEFSEIYDDIYIVLRYDGSSASIEGFNVFSSLRKARKFIKEDTIGLKRRV